MIDRSSRVRTLLLLGSLLLHGAHLRAGEGSPASAPIRVAGVVTVYRHNSHADVILSRLLQTDTLDGKGRDSPLQLVSLYVDQRPKGDLSPMLAASHRFPIYDTIADALTLKTGKLAVDGLLIVAEHGDYPRSPTGNTQYPKRRFWDQVFAVFRSSDRVVPVFSDKHLADNWTDAHHIYATAKAMHVPLMAGSSLPVTWRRPAADVRRGAKLREMVVLTYGSADAYGFHALELAQALAEQRAGGETGIAAVRCLKGDAVWQAQKDRLFDPELFQAAWDRLTIKRDNGRPLAEVVKEPLLFRIEYVDGLVTHVLELNGAIGEWAVAWRYDDSNAIESTQFWTQEGRPAMHFAYLLQGIEQMMLSGKPTWPAERTLLTSGTLDALLNSRAQGGKRLVTPHLHVPYQTDWRWHQPPPPPPIRPWAEQ
ncbi:MAG: hypothetical protein ACC645_01390 [Pirellulales bacterium]